mmetsp:Transcript_19827/g.27288  ORF Transcript_19827/g.27288 Transcript_19827/m.27288 type:complete len:243 (+) Transcript_19827:751-1479(+)
MASLCQGDKWRPLKIEVFDFDKKGRHHFMGQAETSVDSLLRNCGVPMFLIEPELVKSRRGYSNSGWLTACEVLLESHPTFAEFVAGGCEVSLLVAVDFTASNGPHSDPSSLHHIQPDGRYSNPYQQTILAIGNVLQRYGTDHQYPLLGFGAQLVQPNDELSMVQHCFPLSGSGVEVHGVESLLKTYEDCMSRVLMSGPTLLAPVITAAANIAAEYDTCSRCPSSSWGWATVRSSRLRSSWIV